MSDQHVLEAAINTTNTTDNIHALSGIQTEIPTIKQLATFTLNLTATLIVFWANWHIKLTQFLLHFEIIPINEINTFCILLEETCSQMGELEVPTQNIRCNCKNQRSFFNIVTLHIYAFGGADSRYFIVSFSQPILFYLFLLDTHLPVFILLS